MRKTRLLAALFAGLIAAGLTSVTTASADEGTFLVSNAHSGYCLDVAYGSTANGARIQQWNCYAGPPEKWRFLHTGNGEFNIINGHSGKCLDLPNGNANTPAGTALTQWTCWAGVMQRWTVHKDNAGRVQIRSVANPQLCVDNKDWSPSPGSTVQATWCGDWNAQKWNRIRV